MEGMRGTIIHRQWPNSSLGNNMFCIGEWQLRGHSGGPVSFQVRPVPCGPTPTVSMPPLPGNTEIGSNGPAISQINLGCTLYWFACLKYLQVADKMLVSYSRPHDLCIYLLSRRIKLCTRITPTPPPPSSAIFDLVATSDTHALLQINNPLSTWPLLSVNGIFISHPLGYHCALSY